MSKRSIKSMESGLKALQNDEELPSRFVPMTPEIQKELDKMDAAYKKASAWMKPLDKDVEFNVIGIVTDFILGARKAMKEEGIKKKKLSELSGIDKKRISDIFSEEKFDVSIEEMIKISIALNRDSFFRMIKKTDMIKVVDARQEQTIGRSLRK